MIRKSILLTIIAMAMMMAPLCLSTGFAETESGEGDFKTYELREGYWVSHMALVKGLPINRIVEWNKEIIEEHGMRDIPAGTELRYKPPQMVYEEVKEQQRKTRQKVKAYIEKKKRELRGKVEYEGEKTRETVEKETDKVQKEVEGQGDSLFTLKVLSFVILGLLLLLIALFVYTQKNSSEEKEDGPSGDTSSGGSSSGSGSSQTSSASSGASASTSSSSFDTNKLKRLEQVKLSPETGEEEVEFHLGGHKFKGLIPYDANRGHQTWQLKSDNSNEYQYSKTRQSALKSIKGLLKNYLEGTLSNRNQIEKAISGGKIQKIS